MKAMFARELSTRVQQEVDCFCVHPGEQPGGFCFVAISSLACRRRCRCLPAHGLPA